MAIKESSQSLDQGPFFIAAERRAFKPKDLSGQSELNFRREDGTPSGSQWSELVYRQSYGYNAFGNITERNHLHWGGNNFNLSRSYQNDRVTNTGFEHDADGRETAGEGYIESTYDAAGQLVYYNSTPGQGETQINRYYNGDGREDKRKERRYITLDGGENWDWMETISYLHYVGYAASGRWRRRHSSCACDSDVV